MKQLSKNKWARRGFVFLMAFILVMTMAPASVFANDKGDGEPPTAVFANDKGGGETFTIADTNGGLLPFGGISSLEENLSIKVYIDLEGYNLGQGFYIEPKELTLPEGATAADATIEALEQEGLTYYADAPWGFYLSRIDGIDKGTVTPPDYITIALGAGSGDGSLGEFDYTSEAGWMNTVNHEMLSVGEDDYVLNDGDVIRWQFSVQGWGEDFGVETWDGPSSLYTHADKTELIRSLFAADVKDDAKPMALAVIIDPLATEQEVADALSALKKREIIFDVTPAGAVVAVYDNAGTRQWPSASKVFDELTADATYTYTIALSGYVTKSGSFVNDSVKTITEALSAVASSPLTDISKPGDWLSTRGKPNNMGDVDTETPRTATEGELKWAKQFGSGGGAFPVTPNSPIILEDVVVDANSGAKGMMILATGSTIHQINKNNGEIIKSAAMIAAPSFGITSIAYGDGMVFAPISNGRIQAFDAATLESLWVSEQLGGQSLSPIVYHDGYIYTGYWQGETADQYYVCLSTADEDPASLTETKTVQWKHKHTGGFYWAGGLVQGDYIIVGSDNGAGTGNKEDPSVLYALDRITGEVADVKAGLVGDQRSGISYDGDTGKLFFTTKAGYLNSIEFDVGAGKFSNFLSQRLEAGWEATGTPVIHDGVAFVGTGGGPSAPGKLVAADADTLAIIATADLLGYPQGSPLLSTGYEGSDILYLYVTYNARPGGLAVAEYDKTAKTLTKSEVFTPPTAMQQNCLSSPVGDVAGTVYYHNDSGYMFAISKNTAILEDLSADTGVFKQDFKPWVQSYDLIVPYGTKEVVLTFAIPAAMSATVNDSPNSSGTAAIALVADKGVAEIVVSDGLLSRAYTVNIGAPVTGLTVSINESNTAPGAGSFRSFDGEKTYRYFSDASDSTWKRVWFRTDDPDATMKAYVVSGVGNSTTLGSPLRDTGTELALTSGIWPRLNLNWGGSPAASAMEIKVEVTAADAIHKEEYYIKLFRHDYTIDYASEIFTIGSGHQYAITNGIVAPTKAGDWKSAQTPVALTARLNSSVAAKPVISYIHIRSVAEPGAVALIPLVRYGGFTAARLKAGAYFNTIEERFELDADVYSGSTVNYSANSNMASPAAATGLTIPAKPGTKAGKVYVQAVPARGFKSAVATLDIPALTAVNNWNSNLKIGSFIKFDHVSFDLITDPTGSSVVRWIVPDAFYDYEYTTVKNAIAQSDYKPIVAGEQVDTDLYDGSAKATIYVRRAASAVAAAGKQSPAFTLAASAGAPKPKFNGVSMSVTGVKTTMEYMVIDKTAGAAPGTVLQKWTVAPGAAIPVDEAWEGATMYVRTAATPARMYSATGAGVMLEPRTDIGFGTIAGGIDPAAVFKYNVGKGTIALHPKSTIHADFTALKYSSSSKIEISMNGVYWVPAATAKDLRPYLNLYADKEGIKGTLYVRIVGGGSGAKAVNTSRGELITINIDNGSIVANADNAIM